MRMSDRKPHGQGWTNWVDELVAKAEREGAFENLPGAGKPIRDLDKPYDEDWWLRSLLEREQLGITPEPLELRKKIELLREELPKLRDERSARGALLAINALVGRVNALPPAPGIAPVAPVDVEAELKAWRRAAR